MRGLGPSNSLLLKPRRNKNTGGAGSRPSTLASADLAGDRNGHMTRNGLAFKVWLSVLFPVEASGQIPFREAGG